MVQREANHDKEILGNHNPIHGGLYHDSNPTNSNAFTHANSNNYQYGISDFYSDFRP